MSGGIALPGKDDEGRVPLAGAGSQKEASVDDSTARPPHPTEKDRTHRHAVVVSALTYCCVWWCVFAVHCTAAAFVLGAAFAHFTLSLPAIHASTSVLRIPVLLKRVTAVSYLVVAVVHLLAVGRLVRRSLRHGRLALANHDVNAVYGKGSDAHLAHHNNAVARLYDRVRRVWCRIFGADGYLGINGPLFTDLLVYRELVEIAMQSYQLWSLSYNVSRAWIHTFAVGAVVLNCFSIALVNRIFYRQETTRRLMHLVVDMYLDFSCTVVVPVCVLVPYVLRYDWTRNAYPLELILDDVWMANAVGEARQVLVTTYPDFLASLLPQYSIFSCLRVLKRLVQRRPTPRSSLHRGAVVPLAPTSTNEEARRRPHVVLEAADTEHRSIRIVRIGIMVWGVILLGLHVHAGVVARAAVRPGCRQFVRPWLPTSVPCSVLYVNCYRQHISGSANDIAAVLDVVGTSELTKLTFLHCPALTMPARLVSFGNLNSIELFNSTLVDWPMDAAIRASTHAILTTIYFGKTQLASFPAGLLHNELPRALTAIGFYNATVPPLPSDLGDLWAGSHVQRLGFESTNVRVMPLSLGRLPFNKLWMTDNQLEQFPRGMFINSSLASIRLSGNPLRELPDRVGDTTQLSELLAEHTNITTLPEWATTWLATLVDPKTKRLASFYGSPVCDPASNALRVEIKSHVCARDLQSSYGFVPYELVQNKFAV